MRKHLCYGKIEIGFGRALLIIGLLFAFISADALSVFADDRIVDTPAGPVYIGPKYKMTYTGPPVTIRYSNYYAESNLCTKNCHETVVDFIERESEGKIKFKRYWGGTLHGQKDGFQALRGGVTDITNAYPIYNSTSFQLANVGELPFAFRNPYIAALVLEELYPKYLKSEYEKMGVYLAWYTAIGDYGIIAKKPIRKLEDLKGLKIRTDGGLFNDIYKKLGAAPMNMPAQDMYNSFSKGVFDAITFDQGLIVPWKLYEVGKYYSVVNVNRVSIPFGMNKKTYDSLPPELKKDFYNLLRRAGIITAIGYDNQMKISIKQLKDLGVEVIEPTPEEQARWAKAVESVWDDFIKTNEAKGRPAKEMVAELKRLTKKYEGWTAKQALDYVVNNPPQGIID